VAFFALGYPPEVTDWSDRIKVTMARVSVRVRVSRVS